jgi:nucleoside 2-deoxyribosyltransferase
VPEKPDLLVASLAKLSRGPEEWLELDWDRDISLACARNAAELRFYTNWLIYRSLAEKKEHSDKPRYRLTLDGWQRFNELHQTRAASRVGFVAMSFSDDMLDLWEPVFVPALEAAGFKAERSMAPAHNDRIDVAIIAAIKRSRFVVADVTHAKTGVYFEAGYALGLGLPVIWACKDAQKNDMHFDTRQYAHILWKSGEELRQQLTDRIIATI